MPPEPRPGPAAVRPSSTGPVEAARPQAPEEPLDELLLEEVLDSLDGAEEEPPEDSEPPEPPDPLLEPPLDPLPEELPLAAAPLPDPLPAAPLLLEVLPLLPPLAALRLSLR